MNTSLFKYEGNIVNRIHINIYDIFSNSFETLWNNVFPNVTISNYCQVSGKCYTCSAIIERQEFFKSEEELIMTRELTHLHKILIQMQREAYQNVRKLAMDHPELYMSVIIDGRFKSSSVLLNM